MKKILFVCTGNTCRSPMAAALVNAQHDPEYYAESAGIDAFWGDGISLGALDALKFIGTPIDSRNPYSDHHSHKITEEDVKNASLVVGITAMHAEILRQLFPAHRDKITSFAQDISDPSGGDTTTYLLSIAAIRNEIAFLFNEYFPQNNGIQLASVQDATTLWKIENASFSTPWSLESFLLGMKNPTNHTIILKEDGNIIGFAVYSVLFEDAELYDIAVDPAHRKKGIGDKLLQAVLRDCFERGAETIRLEVRESNLPARKLYEKHGFLYEKNVRKNYYQNPTEDALLMYLTFVIK